MMPSGSDSGVWKPESLAETETIRDGGIQFDIPRETLILRAERKFLKKQVVWMAWAGIASAALLLFF